MNTNNQRFIFKVVDMYYNLDLSQESIAKKLNVSRTTIYRALTRAKKEGVVKIQIDFSPQSTAGDAIEIESALEQKYGLKEAVVAMSKYELFSDPLVASHASQYLLRVIRSGMILSVTWGLTIRSVVDCFCLDVRNSFFAAKDLTVVPILGTTTVMDGKDEDYRLTYSNILTTKIGAAMNASTYQLSAPMFVSSEAVKRTIENEEQVATVLDLAKRSDLALFGIGAISNKSSMALSGLMHDSDVEDLLQRGGVGEIAGKIYDNSGTTILAEFNRPIVGVSLEELRKIPTRVGIAYGQDKVKAIKGALNGGVVNVLITDSLTALALLQE